MSESPAQTASSPLTERERQRLFDAFYREHYEISFRYLRARRFPENHTRDVLHHCFVLAWQRFDEYLTAGRPRYWFLGILKNRERYLASRLALDPGASPEQVAANRDDRPGPADLLLDAERQSYFFDTICALPAHYADVVKLRLEGFEYKKIAELLGITVKSAEHRMRRALVKLEAPVRSYVEDYLKQ